MAALRIHDASLGHIQPSLKIHDAAYTFQGETSLLIHDVTFSFYTQVTNLKIHNVHFAFSPASTFHVWTSGAWEIGRVFVWTGGAWETADPV